MQDFGVLGADLLPVLALILLQASCPTWRAILGLSPCLGIISGLLWGFSSAPAALPNLPETGTRDRMRGNGLQLCLGWAPAGISPWKGLWNIGGECPGRWGVPSPAGGTWAMVGAAHGGAW